LAAALMKAQVSALLMVALERQTGNVGVEGRAGDGQALLLARPLMLHPPTLFESIMPS
jgi:hypothetical protein